MPDRPTMEWYRVVDAHNQGWHPARTVEGGTVLSADYGWKRGLDDQPSYEALAAARGPLRPVLPITGNDEQDLRLQCTIAGRRAVTSLAAALEVVFTELRDRSGGDYQRARTWLAAGREGSWESEALIGVVLFGNGLNLAPATRTLQDVSERRKAGPSKRVNASIRDAMGRIILRWVTEPERFTEVAETLAGLVAGFADGPDGWAKIADQWLQPASLAQDDFHACYRLLYSQSRHYDSNL